MEPTNKFDKILTVSQLNHSVNQMLEINYPIVLVTGEISNFKPYPSGHWYFVLKDKNSEVNSVMFKSNSSKLNFLPKDGDKVELKAKVKLYLPKGAYQLNVEVLKLCGVGSLYESFLKLKNKLRIEGLFNEERKMKIPFFPKKIGIITSLQGAALQDTLKTFKRRTPHILINVYPTIVQGSDSIKKIINLVNYISHEKSCDLLILCRGGGSIEDLWSFNDEGVARAIYKSKIPIITGIGHETDFTIADFVSDLRASTPTAAAEISSLSKKQWLTNIEKNLKNLNKLIKDNLDVRKQNLDWINRNVQGPAQTINSKKIILSKTKKNLNYELNSNIKLLKFNLFKLKTKFLNKKPDTSLFFKKLEYNNLSISKVYKNNFINKKNSFYKVQENLNLLSPQKTLLRGYSIIQNEDNQIIKDPNELFPLKKLKLTLAKGTAKININNIKLK
tara:strand:- start:184 stop:1521 length:1338 start_codon:yes stop_codon:yes gene_type:complete